jgi:hypothetical protein
MRHWALSAAIGAAISTSGLASPAQGLITGIYVLDRGESDNVLEAIESAVAGLPNAQARSNMIKANLPLENVRIVHSAGRFSIKSDARPLILVTLGGEPIEWKPWDGQVFQVSAKANGEAVSLTFSAPDSERTTVYHSVGQQLVAETTVLSPRFSTPIHYRVVYNRTN